MAVRKHVFATNEFEQLLQKEFKPKTEEAKSAVTNAVATLAPASLTKCRHHFR